MDAEGWGLVCQLLCPQTRALPDVYMVEQTRLGGASVLSGERATTSGLDGVTQSFQHALIYPIISFLLGTSGGLEGSCPILSGSGQNEA